MTYTPINWQTGDTITADKLNKMDNGWGVSSTQLFSETVTTADQGGMNNATLAYSGTIDADTIAVTFDGTEYTCPRIDAFNAYYYGGFSEQGPVFTEYPFALQSFNGANTVFTETTSTHTIAVVVPTLQTSADFSKAVSAVIGGAFYPLVYGTTTWRQVVDAMAAGKLVLRMWGNTYDGDTTPDSIWAGIELATDAYVDAHGDYYVSAIVTENGVQAVKHYSAITADEALSIG